MALLTPEYLQTKTYAAIKDRYVMQHSGPIQEGAWGASDLKVAQRAAGANMSVDVAAGSAWIQGDSVARQGLYHLVNDATINAAIPSNASGNPRLDQIILRAYDSTDAASGTDVPQIEVLQGTPTAGATLDNRSGAAALPATAMRLADVLVANGAASISNSAIRDRRAWARGFKRVIQLTSGDYNFTSSAYTEITADARARLECVGNPVRASFFGNYSHSVASALTMLHPLMDSAVVDGVSNGTIIESSMSTAGKFDNIMGAYYWTPAAGSHLFSWALKTFNATATIKAAAASPCFVVYEELLLPATGDNGTA